MPTKINNGEIIQFKIILAMYTVLSMLNLIIFRCNIV